METSTDITVSICCIAYNQEKYIRQCLDGFMMQKTNFKFEVLIHDDASTDSTADIIREYEQKYPDIIKPIYQTENQYSKGISVSNFNYSRVTGKYIALCEGDDYWTDPLKLQKQFDFMEANPDYTVCTHIVKMISDPPVLPDGVIPDDAYEKDYSNITFNDILIKYFHTSSYFFRWNIGDKYERPKGLKYGDKPMLVWFAKQGKVKFIPEEMSVYRRNPNGVFAGQYMSTHETQIPVDICYNLMDIRKYLYNMAIDKEWYFKVEYYPGFTNTQYHLLKRNKWKSLFDLTCKNADIYLLMLKHWRVMPCLIWQDTYKLLKKFYKVITNKS